MKQIFRFRKDSLYWKESFSQRRSGATVLVAWRIVRGRNRTELYATGLAIGEFMGFRWVFDVSEMEMT